MFIEAKRLSKIYADMSALIKNGWSQGSNARDVSGNPVNSISDDAVSWCMIGAYTKIRQDSPLLCSGLSWQWAFAMFKERHKINRSISEWNDASDRSQQEIVDALDISSDELNSRGADMIYLGSLK